MTQPTAAATSANPASTEAGAASAGNGLADLLAEFDKPTGGQPAPSPDPLKVLAPIVQYVADERRTKIVEAVKQDVDQAISFMAEVPELKDVPKRVVRGLIEGYGAENPVLMEAFNNRKQDPAGYQKALADCRSAILEDWKAVGARPGARSDVEAAVLAARGTSTQPSGPATPSNAKMWNMSQREWKAYTDELLAAKP